MIKSRNLFQSTLRYFGILSLVAVAALAPSFVHAATPFVNIVTTANVTPTNDQTDVTTTSTANVVQTKASRVLTVNSLPVASTTTTIGSCVITYSSTVADSLNCSGNTAIINTVTHGTALTVAAAIRSLTNVSDAAHGALTIASSSADASFTTTGVETSASNISFTDGTTGVVTSGTPVTGVVPVAQRNTVTVGGTVDTGDTFSITIPTGVVTYTTQTTDTSLANIANGIDLALVATSSYASQTFTVATSSNTVVLTAKTAGTPFTQTSSQANGSPVAEVVSFTPPAANAGAFISVSIIINANTYTYTYNPSTASSMISSLVSSMAADPVATCVASGSTAVICTAKTPGTPFTYNTSVMLPSSSGGGGGGGGGGSSSGGGGGSVHFTVTQGTVVSTPHTTVFTTPAVPVTPVVTTTGSMNTSGVSAAKITKTLTYGAENNSVKVLQQLLAQDPTLGFKGTVSGYFGLQTRAAVEAFQVKYGVVAAGAPGYGSVGPKTRAELTTVFGS